MFNVFGLFISERRRLVINECEMLMALKILDDIKSKSRFYGRTNMELGRCGDDTRTVKWFMHFDCTGNQWKKFVRSMNEANYRMTLSYNGKCYLVEKIGTMEA